MFKNMGLQAKMIAGFCSIFLAVILNSFVMYNTTRSLLETTHWVDHTWEVLDHGNQLIKLLVDMETGERGYLITGEERFLEP